MNVFIVASLLFEGLVPFRIIGVYEDEGAAKQTFDERNASHGDALMMPRTVVRSPKPNVFSDNPGFPVLPENSGKVVVQNVSQKPCFILSSGEPDSHTWGVYDDEDMALRVQNALEAMGKTVYLEPVNDGDIREALSDGNAGVQREAAVVSTLRRVGRPELH